MMFWPEPAPPFDLAWLSYLLPFVVLPFAAWPAALNLTEAAEYCGLSPETFKERCPIKPIEFTESTRGNRYRRASLDEWLASIDPNVSTSPTRRFGERLSGGQGAVGRA